MMHTTQALYGQLNDTLHTINAQIEAIKKRVERDIEASPWAPEGTTVYDWQDTTGKSVLGDLLVAKASVLSGMAQLKAADVTSKAPVARERRR